MDSQRHASFADVARLTADAWQQLLVAGHGVERIWAAWALGMRHAGRFSGQLRETLAREPDPGVRRHIAVVLAGLGERIPLMVLAELDPDERVRATACQYVVRLAAPDDEAGYQVIVRALDEKRSKSVCLAIIYELGRDAPAAVRARIESMAETSDLELAWAVQNKLLSWAPDDEFPAVLKPRSFIEPDTELREHLWQSWLRREGVRSLLRASWAPSITRDAVLTLLHFCGAMDIALDWSLVQPLTARRDLHIDVAVVLACNPIPDASERIWLSSLVLRLFGDKSFTEHGEDGESEAIEDAGIRGLQRWLTLVEGSGLCTESELAIVTRLRGRAERLLPEALEGWLQRLDARLVWSLPVLRTLDPACPENTDERGFVGLRAVLEGEDSDWLYWAHGVQSGLSSVEVIQARGPQLAGEVRISWRRPTVDRMQIFSLPVSTAAELWRACTNYRDADGTPGLPEFIEFLGETRASETRVFSSHEVYPAVVCLRALPRELDTREGSDGRALQWSRHDLQRFLDEALAEREPVRMERDCSWC